MALSRKEQRRKDRLAAKQAKRMKLRSNWGLTQDGGMSDLRARIIGVLVLVMIVTLIAAIALAMTMNESDKPLMNTLFFTCVGSIICIIVGVVLPTRKDKVNS